MLKAYNKAKSDFEMWRSRGTGKFELVLGVSSSQDAYVQNIRTERQQLELRGGLWLQGDFGGPLDPKKVEAAKLIYQQVREGNQESFLEQTLWDTLLQYRKVYSNETESMAENVGVKLILWMEGVASELEINSGEVFFYGSIKKHQWSFLYWMQLLGISVRVENPCGDFEDQLVKMVPDLIIKRLGNGLEALPTIENPPLFAKESHPKTMSNVQTYPSNPKQELDYETLAQLSESVVMIRVYDDAGTPVASGSGVVLNEKGYLLTNFHVVCQGATYGVCFENDSTEYPSTGMIKYHTDFDIALIRVERTTRPLPLGEKPLVRGQRIAAIGSPLGLINTISDGIVSGFRNFKDVDMIQFTAPISSGSSGGALLNLYGELVGVTTAGFDGQNLNLAVPVSYIRLFAGNYLNP